VQEVKLPPHTEYRKGSKKIQYRRRVPDELIPYIGRDEFRHSLRTSDIEVARTRAAFRNAEVEFEFEQARAKLRADQAGLAAIREPLTPEAQRYVADAVHARVLDEDEQVRMSRPDGETLDIYHSLRADEDREVAEALDSGRVAVGEHAKQGMVQLLRRVGVSVTPSSPAWDAAAFKATEGLSRALNDISSRRRGTYVPTPTAPDLPPELRSHTQDSAPVELQAQNLTLGRVIDEYVASLQENGFKRKIVRCLQLFGELVGRELPASDLRQRVVTQFLRDICKLPDKWARRFDKGETVQAMLAEEADKVMSPTTYEGNYRAPFGTFLVAAARDYGDDGFRLLTVEGIGYSGNRVADEDQQRALLDAELRTLFEGNAFRRISTDPEQEPLYWLLIVLLFTGARPREVCQANPQVDFGQVDGHWYIDLDEHSAAGKGVSKSIKSGEARRIPLHPELIRLGFPKYVERVKAAGADRLFPTWRVKQGNPFTAHYERVSDLLKEVGLYTRQATPGMQVTGAYTLRKTFITYCRNQGVVSKEITGHSDGTTTAMQDRHYIFGPEPFARKIEEMRKLVLPVRIPAR
jgi:integrase